MRIRNYFLSGFIVFVGVFLTCLVASAADMRDILKTRDEYLLSRGTQAYENMVDDLYRAKGVGIAYGQLRGYYSTSSYYDPFANTITDRMTALAYTASQDKDQIKVTQALEEYRKLLRDNIANLDVVLLALTFGSGDVRLGNTAFLETVKRGLVDSVRFGVDGLSPQKAFTVITYGEEAYLLQKIGGKKIDTEITNVEPFYYDIIDLEDSKTGKTKTIYVNITAPVRHVQNMIKRKAEEKKAIEIPKTR